MRSIPERSGVDKAYGEIRYTWGTTPTDYRFTGQRQDGGLGLYHMGARWYDPYLGRWLSPDSIVPEPGNPQSLNRYSYVYNQPVRYRDEDGHFPLPPLPTWEDVKEGFQAGVESVKALAVGDFEEAGKKWLYASLSASGIKRQIMNTAEACWSLNEATQTVFSNQPLEERILPAVKVGTFAVGVANIPAMGLAGPGVARAESQYATRLFRAVSEQEFQQLMKTGKLQITGASVEGKYFATTMESAAAWGERLMGSGKFRIVAVDLPPELVEAFYFFENLDQIGPAYLAVCQILCKSWQPGSLAGIGIFLNVRPRITA